jgi:hypothetical protein
VEYLSYNGRCLPYNERSRLTPQIGREVIASDVAIKALDLITIVIPPALPAAMTVGKLYAQNRLQACKIYCINSRVINVAGSINCVCFDKVREPDFLFVPRNLRSESSGIEIFGAYSKA